MSEDLRKALIECGRAAGAIVDDRASDAFLLGIPEEVKAKLSAQSPPPLVESAERNLPNFLDAARKPLPSIGDVRALAAVTQGDRDAAASLWDKMRDAGYVEWQSDWMRDGTADSGPVVQAFARERQAALSAQSPPPADDVVERVARYIQDWRDGNAGEDTAADTARLVLALVTRVQSPLPIMGEGLVEYVATLLWYRSGARGHWNAIGHETREEQRKRARADLAALAIPSLPEGMVMVPRDELADYEGVIRNLIGELSDPGSGALAAHYRIKQLLATSPASDLRIKGEE